MLLPHDAPRGGRLDLDPDHVVRPGLLGRAAARRVCAASAAHPHGASGPSRVTRAAYSVVMSTRVKIVERAHAALNCGDIDAFVALCDPRFRLDMSDRVMNPAVYEGPEGIRRFYSEVREVWESYTWEPEQILDSGDQVVALLRSRGRGRGSGIEIERKTAIVWAVEGDRATSLQFYRDRNDALQAAGIAGLPRD
jgi:ketosteroid isomerase-like protein